MFSFGIGIYNVGRAAEHPPALIVLSHRPEGATKNIAWVGKGIVFDTGGLCIKARVGIIHTKNNRIDSSLYFST